MYGPITIPFSAKLLFNTIRLKQGVTYDDVELAHAEMCVVKETYGGNRGGFIAGQVFRFSGFVSDEGSLGSDRGADHDLVIRNLLALVRRARALACRCGIQGQSHDHDRPGSTNHSDRAGLFSATDRDSSR